MLHKLLLSLALMLTPYTLSHAVCPVNVKQCSFQVINNTDIPLVMSVTGSPDIRVTPNIIPSGSTTIVIIDDLFKKDLGSLTSLKISSVPAGKTTTGGERSISDTVIFDVKERKLVLPNYTVPSGETERENGIKFGSFYHESKESAGSLNNYDKIEIEQASTFAPGKFFNMTGIKTSDGREVKVSFY